MDPLHLFAPQHAGFHHIGFFHRTQPVAAPSRQLKRRPRHAADFTGGVALGVDADPPALIIGENPARFAEINPAGQLTDDHDIQPRHHLALQAGEIGKGVETLRRAQVGEQVHLLAQPQQPAFGLQAEIEHIILRPAHRTQQHGIGRLRPFHRFIGQGRAVGIIGTAAHQPLGQVEMDGARGGEPADHLAHLCHHFGADAVAGQDEDGRVGHGGSFADQVGVA